MPVLSSEKHVSPDVLILNVCDKRKDEMFLHVLRTFSSINSLKTLLDELKMHRHKAEHRAVFRRFLQHGQSADITYRI